MFRFVGFGTQQHQITGGMTNLDVRMFVSILDIEEVVVVGITSFAASCQGFCCPCGCIWSRDLAAQSSTDLDDILRTQVPSYNVQRHGIDDEATLVRPVTLRGLPADNVVLLIKWQTAPSFSLARVVSVLF